MGKILRYKMGQYDSIILDIIGDESIEWTDLISKGSENKIPSSTLYKRIKQLESYGFIERINIVKAAKKYVEAKPREIRDIIDAIEKTKNMRILKDRIKQLNIISRDSRVVHHPRIISTIEACLDRPDVFNNDEIYEDVMNSLYNMLRFERNNPSPDSNIYINELSGELLSRVLTIFEEKPGFTSRFTCLYFGENTEASAVNVIFSKIKKHAKEIDLENSWLTNALRRSSPLYQANLPLINRKIDELLSFDDEELASFATLLRESIMLGR